MVATGDVCIQISRHHINGESVRVVEVWKNMDGEPDGAMELVVSVPIEAKDSVVFIQGNDDE